MKVDTPPLFSPERLEAILREIASVRIGVLGDLCLDLYWHADMTRSVLSRETPHFPLPIVREEASPGAAGNVAGNIAALAPDNLSVLGILGMDWRGDLLLCALREKRVHTERILRADGRVTNAYIKPMRKGFADVVYEDPRLDFDNDAPPAGEIERALIERLDQLAPSLDALCVCDQMRAGCVTPAVREAVMRWGQKGLKIVVDSRDHIGAYRHVVVKPNEMEGATAVRSSAGTLSLDALAEVAAQLVRRNGKPALVTAGNRGCLLADGDAVHWVPACPVPAPHDICGAGDTFMAAFTLAYGGGATLVEAVYFANMAAAVTIRKIGMTGTASADEIRGAHAAWRAAGTIS